MVGLLYFYNNNFNAYRYGYQGLEMDNEVNGTGNSYTTEFRQLDPRLGRWMSVDPVFQPWQSPYTSMDNNPINLTDVRGLKAGGKGKGGETSTGKKTRRVGKGDNQGLTTTIFSKAWRGIKKNVSWIFQPSHIKQAMAYAKKVGGEFDMWRGKNGRLYASVKTGHIYEGTGRTKENGDVVLDDSEIRVDVFRPEKSGDNAWVRFGKWFDKKTLAVTIYGGGVWGILTGQERGGATETYDLKELAGQIGKGKDVTLKLLGKLQGMTQELLNAAKKAYTLKEKLADYTTKGFFMLKDHFTEKPKPVIKKSIEHEVKREVNDNLYDQNIRGLIQQDGDTIIIWEDGGKYVPKGSSEDEPLKGVILRENK